MCIEMKRTWIMPALMALALVVTAFALTGCGDSNPDGQARQYTCPMKEHSEVVQDKPGNCSKCGMKLVEKK